jgi:hypothetical protein
MTDATVFAEADDLQWRWSVLAARPTRGGFGGTSTTEHEEDPP